MRRPEYWTIYGTSEQICGRYRSLRDAREAAHNCELDASHNGCSHTIVKVILVGRAAKTGRRNLRQKG